MKLLKRKSTLRQRLSSVMGIQCFLVTVLTIILTACGNEPQSDIRPADQKHFIGIVKSLRDQTDRTSVSDGNRPVMIDEGVKMLKKHIVDTLNSTFKGWDVRVLDNKKTDPNGDETRVNFGMSIDNFNLEETSRFKSVVFRESLTDIQPDLRKKLQSLKIGDHVKISGAFITRDKKIDVDPYAEKEYKISKNIFSNPEFRVELTAVEIN